MTKKNVALPFVDQSFSIYKKEKKVVRKQCLSLFPCGMLVCSFHDHHDLYAAPLHCGGNILALFMHCRD